MTHGEATARMPFGGFFGRRLGERTIAGFSWARFVPNLRKRQVRRHRHDEAHFVFVLRGNYETTARPVREAAGPVLIYSPPGTEHQDCFVDEDLSQAAFATLSVSPAALGSVEEEAQLPTEEVCLPQSAAILVRRIAAESSGQDDLSGSIAEALCIELLQRTGVERDAAARAAPAWLRRARELLRDSCLATGPRSVREIACELDVHPVHLARRFRQHFDMTPGDYLRRCRLDHARSLLQKSRAGLADIAAATGFCDQSHFTNAFRRAFGVSPGRFRRS